MTLSSLLPSLFTIQSTLQFNPPNSVREISSFTCAFSYWCLSDTVVNESKEMMMKISAFKMILAVTPLIISSCTSFRDARFDESMKDLRSQVSEGDNIYAAKKENDS
ncbi:hypothetical protein N9958_00040 [bacterium]|nr:hypothetical protein [bacterium]